MGNNIIKENNIEKSLTTKGEKSLTIKDKQKKLAPILKTATGIIFYAATFIVSIAIGYMFIFSVFN
ncbi:MAG: hypothetical protein IJ220_00330 [Clostridia bacterium]|nr:hypothetical protein [Clostridia bacterium]